MLTTPAAAPMPLLRRLPLPLWLLLLVTPAIAEPVLNYSVTYRGVFSMGTDLEIADVTLDARRPQPGADLIEARLEASSERYPAVEALYPFRYRFRSWSAIGDAAGVVAFENYEKTGRENHAVYLTGRTAKQPARRLSLEKAADDRRLAALEAGAHPTPQHPIPAVWDRLGLLQHVRQLGLDEQGKRHYFDVTNGRKRYRYRVRVEAAKSLVVDGLSIPAWKVRFDGERLHDDGDREPAHRPLYVWFSQDPARVPLRIDLRHAIGRFRVELEDAEGLSRVARASD